MIFGIGCDLCEISRFEKYWEDTNFINRFFNKKEIKSFSSKNRFTEYYASRFAAKEAFVKALGTGFIDFNLSDIFITNNESGKPVLNVENDALKELNNLVTNPKLHVSLSHEKEYAQAFVVIEE